MILRHERWLYAQKANRIAIHRGRDRVVAVIEIVSPGNKDGKKAFGKFVDKAEDMLGNGINLVVVDLFPPSKRDPQGIHPAIWQRIHDEAFTLPAGKPLTAAAYRGGEAPTAYVENLAVGDPLPALPIFLDPDHYIPAPLEIGYLQAWAVFPAMLKEDMIESPGN